MSLKLIGAIAIVAACGSVGFSMAATHRKEEASLRQLIHALDMMSCELQQHLMPLPQLCRIAAKDSKGCIGRLFTALAHELELQVAPDAGLCMEAALANVPQITPLTRSAAEQLGGCLGRFDLEGQLNGLQSVRTHCLKSLESLECNRESRLRGYQTLGLCAGAALAILLL